MTARSRSNVPSLSDLVDNKTESDENATPVDAPVEPENSANGSVETTTTAPEVEHNDADDAGRVSGLSPAVVSTVPNKTPAELASETPDEAAARYGIDETVSEQDLENPRVQVYKDTVLKQVPSGTHLHPDVAKDMQNRGIQQQTTDTAQVSRMVTHEYDFAPDAPHNDKWPGHPKDEDNS
jgi:hypothetical protein